MPVVCFQVTKHPVAPKKEEKSGTGGGGEKEGAGGPVAKTKVRRFSVRRAGRLSLFHTECAVLWNAQVNRRKAH